MERISYSEVPAKIFEKLHAIESYMHTTSLSSSLLGLIKLRASQINGCAYCVDMHHKELKHLGETDLRLSSLCVWQETPYFTSEERAVLHFTEVLTKTANQHFPATTFNALTAFFTKAEICALSLAVAQTNTWNRLMKVFNFTPGKFQVPQ